MKNIYQHSLEEVSSFRRRECEYIEWDSCLPPASTDLSSGLLYHSTVIFPFLMLLLLIKLLFLKDKFEFLLFLLNFSEAESGCSSSNWYGDPHIYMWTWWWWYDVCMCHLSIVEVNEIWRRPLSLSLSHVCVCV